MKMIEKIHFNPDKPENMNIYISNMKNKYLMVYDGKNWNIANKTEEIDKLTQENLKLTNELNSLKSSLDNIGKKGTLMRGSNMSSLYDE
jgi:hypothetical protein